MTKSSTFDSNNRDTIALSLAKLSLGAGPPASGTLITRCPFSQRSRWTDSLFSRAPACPSQWRVLSAPASPIKVLEDREGTPSLIRGLLFRGIKWLFIPIAEGRSGRLCCTFCFYFFHQPKTFIARFTNASSLSCSHERDEHCNRTNPPLRTRASDGAFIPQRMVAKAGRSMVQSTRCVEGVRDGRSLFMPVSGALGHVFWANSIGDSDIYYTSYPS